MCVCQVEVFIYYIYIYVYLQYTHLFTIQMHTCISFGYYKLQFPAKIHN